MIAKQFKIQSIFLYFDRQPPLFRYGLALLAVAVAVMAIHFIPVAMSERVPFLTFFFAIIQSAFWLGRNPGLFSMALSLLVINALVLFPAWISKPYDVIILNTGFCAISLFIITTTHYHRRLSTALWESWQRYAGIIESTIDAVISIDADQRIVVFNAAAEKMFGCTAYEANGSPLDRFIPERFRHDHGRHVRTFGGTGNASHRIGQLRTVTGLRASGEEFPVEVSISKTEENGKLSYTAILRDISERQFIETELQQRESELRLIMDATPALIAYLDTDLRYLRVNKTYDSWFGIRPEHIIGHKVQEIIGASAWNIVRPYAEKALAGEMVIFDQPIPYGDNKPRWVNACYIPDKDATGNVKGIVVHVIDIEDRKQAELERQKFVSLADNSQEFIGLCDLNLKPFYINDAGLRLVGLDSREQAFQTHVQDFFFPEDQRFVLEKFFPRVLREKNAEVEIRFRHFQTGAAIWMIYNVFYIKDNEGEVVGLATVSRDITERKLAEAALRESEARLALVIEEVNVGYWDWDLVTNTLYLSREWKRQLGLDENKLTIQWDKKDDRLHPDDRALAISTSEDFIAGRLPVYELEFRLRHKNGSYRWIHSRGALLRDQNNQPYRMLGMNLDITDYKKTKELNLKRDQMEQTFRLYVASQTAAAIAHELNQPLNAITSYADVALQMLKTGNENPQKLCHVIENCGLQAQRAGQVIRQLLALLHKGETISEPININSSVQEALDFVKTNGDPGAFKVELDLAANLPLVTANHLQIQKVMINLIQNGLESIEESGLSAATMTISTSIYADDPAMVLVKVRDNGLGIADPATLKAIFQPFHTTKATGLGMGLAISRALVEAHGGEMWAEQNAGNGISVCFTLAFVL